jgi:hypothetical protein
MTPGIPPQDYELLSAYLDGQLDSAERANLESRLVAEPVLQAALDDLRSTIQILRAAPQLTPPRSFTLDPARYRRAGPWWTQFRLMQTIGGLGALASVLLIALGLLSVMITARAPAGFASQNTTSRAVAAQPTATRSPTLLPVTPAIAENDQTASKETQTTSEGVPSAVAIIATATQSAQIQVATVVASGPRATSTPAPTQPPRTQPPTATQPPTQPPTATQSPTATASPTGQPVSLPAVLPTASRTQPESPQAGAVSGGGETQPAQPTAAAQADETGAQEPSFLATPSPSAKSAAPAIDGASAATKTAPNRPTSTASSTPTINLSDLITATPESAVSNAAAATVQATTAAPNDKGGREAQTAVALATISVSPTPTAANLGKDTGETQPLVSLPQFLLILGIALLIFSALLFAVGWMRSRL